MLLRHLSKSHIIEWMAYHQLEPFGAERDDFRAALQTFWLRAAWLEDSKESPKDFLPQFEEHEPTEAELILQEIHDDAKDDDWWR